MAPSIPQGRLTLTTLTPVLVATVSAATSVIYTPYQGNLVPIWNGVQFVPTPFAELSNVLANSATGNAGPAAVANSSAYDLYLWNNAGVITLTRGPVWTNVTTRSAGAAQAMVNGIIVNNVNITNGPLAGYGTWVGSFASNAGGTVDMIFGGSASGGTAGVFNLWNTYNRKLSRANIADSASAWTYTTATIRPSDGSGTGSGLNNRCTFFVGANEDPFTARFTNRVALLSAVNANGIIGIGLDSTTAYSSISNMYLETLATAQAQVMIVATLDLLSGLGQHYAQALECGDGTNANSFHGQTGGQQFHQLSVGVWN